MDAHKIDNFERVSTGKFPDFRTLQGTELTTSQNRVFSLFEIALNIQLPLEISKMQDLCESRYKTLALDEGFDICEVLREFAVHTREVIYLNWSMFDKIDQIDIYDFSNFFSNIWYPGVGDIDLFDETLFWMISIYHDGIIELKYNTPLHY